MTWYSAARFRTVVDLVAVAVDDGDPGPGVFGVAAVRLGAGVLDDLGGGPADRGEQRLAFRVRPGRWLRRVPAAGAGRAEQGGQDVIRRAGRGRDVGDGGQLGGALAGLAQVSGVVGPAVFFRGLRPRGCGLRGGGPRRSWQHGARRPVAGQQQPGLLRARLRQPGGVERPEITGRADRELPGLAFAQRDRALGADLRRRLAEGHDRGRLRRPLLHPGRVGVARCPVQLRVLRVQVLLPLLAVGDPGRAHRPEDHDPGVLLPVPGGAAQAAVSAGHVIAALLQHRPQPQVRLREQPHQLHPVRHRAILELAMLQGERLIRPRPADHRFRVLAHRGEQRILKITRRRLPAGRPGRREICNAGVHGHRLSSSGFQDATKTGDGGFPMHAPTAPPYGPAAPHDPANPPPAQTTRQHHSYTPICRDTPATCAKYRFIQELDISEGRVSVLTYALLT